MMAPPYPMVQNAARILPIILGLREQSKKLTASPNVKDEIQPARIVNN